MKDNHECKQETIIREHDLNIAVITEQTKEIQEIKKKIDKTTYWFITLLLTIIASSGLLSTQLSDKNLALEIIDIIKKIFA